MSKRKQNATSAATPVSGSSPQAGQHQAALEEIDRMFHEKARLGIMTTLVGSPDGMSFNDLKALCRLTDGNLNRHLKVLVDSGVLSVRKSGQGRSTLSHYRITARGRRAFEKYLGALEQVLIAAKARQIEPKTKPATAQSIGLRPAT